MERLARHPQTRRDRLAWLEHSDCQRKCLKPDMAAQSGIQFGKLPRDFFAHL
jgi:hypothetical protein